MNRPTRTGTTKGRAPTALSRPSLPALLLAALFLWTAEPAAAMQILDAADHAELGAVISDRAVSRIALADDRVARVIRGPDGFVVEHDAARGDVYLRPAGRSGVHVPPGVPREPVTLFIGTRKGFTYRLTLRVAARGSAQILIRNAAATPREDSPKPGYGRVGALVALVRAAAQREIPPGYAIETFSGTPGAEGLTLIEVWRGPRFIARVFEADLGSGDDFETLMQSLAPGVAAIWLAPPASGPSGGRLAVAVREASRIGAAR